MSSGFDVKQQSEAAKAEDEGTVIHIRGIDDLPVFYQQGDSKENKPVTIRVAGVHSRRYRRIEEQLRRRKIKAHQLTGEAIYEDNLERVAACTLEWEGFHAEGKPLQCTTDNVKQVYKQCPWVLEQVLEAMNDHSRFFSSGSQSPTSTSDSSQS